MEMVRETYTAKFLRRVRINGNKTQVEVGKHLGYTSQFIANWERGVSKPPPECLASYMDFVGAGTGELVENMTLDYKLFLKSHIKRGKK